MQTVKEYKIILKNICLEQDTFIPQFVIFLLFQLKWNSNFFTSS